MRIYTSKDCVYCKKLREKLNDLKIDFVEIDVDNQANLSEVAKVYELAGEAVVPIIAKKPHLLVPKRSFNTIDEAIVLIQSLNK